MTIWGLMWWQGRRELRRLDQHIAEDLRQYALRRQLWDMEAAIREEQRSDAQREWQRQYREREAEIQCEARRRLGLSDEE